ncbi:MAG: hypothetical protein JXQ76_09165 [Campylobacterales bacterium]|nr:hypothetical protein [Campylobacterales bacterium]
MRYFIALFVVMVLGGCDKKIINVYDKKILTTPIDCLSLAIDPPNMMMQQTMQKLYDFKEGCKYTLAISYRNCIQCNANFNIQTKAIQGMPSSYLNMEIKEGRSLKYSYYVDLRSNVDEEDLQSGFRHLKNKLKINQ